MKSTRRPARRPAPEPATAIRGNVYLYGIVRTDALGADASMKLGMGVGRPPRPIEMLPHKDVAALLSEVDAAEIEAQGARGMRHDMKAHSALLLRANATMTILPARFGMVFPSAAVLVSQLLEPQYAAIEAHLKRLDGAVEITLRASYVEPEILREIVSEQPALARGSGAGNYQARIETGKRIAAAIQDRREHDARSLIHRLSPLARQVHVGDFSGDLGVLNASFLVGRTKLGQFDKALAEIDSELRHRFTFDCVGPLPPYSFVNLRIA